MPVILHIGYHKTGSTAIQGALLGLTAALAAAGIVLPQSMSRWHGHPDLAWGFGGRGYPWQDRPYTQAEVVAHYTPLLDAAATSRQTLLLSSEEFCRLDFHPDALEALADFLGPWQPRVLGFVRDPLIFLLSRWRHEVQMGSESRPLAAFLADANNLLSADFAKRTSAWCLAFGKAACDFHDYATVCRQHQGSILPGFLELVGAPHLAPMASPAGDGERKMHPLLCNAARGVTQAGLPEAAKAELYTRLFDLSDRLPPLRLEALVEAEPLPAGLAAVLRRIRDDMGDFGLLPQDAA